MNQIQEMKMRLLKEFAISDDKKTVDFCREAYKFLTEDCNEQPAKPLTEVQAIDLGLPSGTLWADRNIGADVPEGVGLYFSWGNTEGHEFGTDYDFDEDYKNTEGSKLDGDIDLEHDAARVNMGEPWRMPTEDDFVELCDNCTTSFESLNGYKGMRFTSKINGNSIFLPCSGVGYGTSWHGRGSRGLYWSSSLYSASYGRLLLFYSGGVYPQYNDYRFSGFAVRAVQTSFYQ